MTWNTLRGLFVGTCLVWLLADDAEARGGGGRGGGGRGGGGFSRGSSGSYGSVRNSARPPPREVSRPSRSKSARPASREASRPPARPAGGQQAGTRPAPESNRLSYGLPNQLPAQGGKRPAPGQKPGQLPAAGNAARPSPLPAGLHERAANLTPGQKQQLRQQYQNGGLKPSQLPDRTLGDGQEARADRRENRQDQRDEARDDWQEWYDDQYHDDWDDHWYSPWWYGAPLTPVSYAFYLDDEPPCLETVVIKEATGTTTYYYCGSIWYQPVYFAGEVKYIVTSPPAGAELATLTNPRPVTVAGREYVVCNHIFYQKVTRNGQALYVSVDAPPGATVPTIPEYAVRVEYQGKSYLRFDRIFYQKQGDTFIIVPNPGL